MTATPRKDTARRRPRSWITAAAILLALAAGGFAFGLVAGIVWEEPGLAYAYFSGDSEEVAWGVASAGSASEVASTPPSAAPTPEKSAAPGPEPSAAPARSAASAPDVAAGPAGPAGRFAVQVGAFASSQAADGLAADLRAKGFDVYVSPGTRAGESRWRVRVGPVPTREAAEQTADRLKQVEKLPTWVLEEDAI